MLSSLYVCLDEEAHPLFVLTCRPALSRVSAVQYMRGSFPAFVTGVFHREACSSSIQGVYMAIASRRQQRIMTAMFLFLMDGAEALYDG